VVVRAFVPKSRYSGPSELRRFTFLQPRRLKNRSWRVHLALRRRMMGDVRQGGSGKGIARLGTHFIPCLEPLFSLTVESPIHTGHPFAGNLLHYTVCCDSVCNHVTVKPERYYPRGFRASIRNLSLYSHATHEARHQRHEVRTTLIPP